MSKIYDALKRAEEERERARDYVPDEGGIVEGGNNNNGPSPRGTVEEEEYRRLRASLLFTPMYSEVHTIAVTSPRHGEGTSRVAVGLAKALVGEGDARVLLFEANLRSPSLSRQFNIPTGRGVADFLAGDVDVESVVTQVSDSNLYLVPAGGAPPIVDCEMIAAGLSRLRADFDFVIVDAPPVHGYADVSVLASKVDGVILVVEADRTPVADAEGAKRALDRVGAHIFGVVLNRKRNYIPAAIQALL